MVSIMSLPGEGQPIDARIHDVHEAAQHIDAVHIGDTVEGFANVHELDIFTNGLISERLRQLRRWDLEPRQISLAIDDPLLGNRMLSYGRGTRYRQPSEALQPKKVRGRQFVGSFTDITVTLLSENIEPFRSGVSIADKDPIHIAILLSANMRSTGRGIVGRSSKLMAVRDYVALPNNRIRSVRYSDLPNDTSRLATEMLLAESESMARAVAVRGLCRAFSAGLPGTGKR